MLKINYKIISENPVFFKSIFTKGIGLMFRRKIKNQYIFTFKKESIIPLHMWFVFTPIDVLFLDEKKRIVEIKENFKPFQFYNPKNKAKYIIELPPKNIKKYKLKISQTASF